jgi:hypothetical protein
MHLLFLLLMHTFHLYFEILLTMKTLLIVVSEQICELSRNELIKFRRNLKIFSFRAK